MHALLRSLAFVLAVALGVQGCASTCCDCCGSQCPCDACPGERCADAAQDRHTHERDVWGPGSDRR